MRLHDTDWLGLCVRFACGAPLGGLLSLAAVPTDAAPQQFRLYVAIGAVIGGTLAAGFGDRFWQSLWWWWW